VSPGHKGAVENLSAEQTNGFVNQRGEDIMKLKMSTNSLSKINYTKVDEKWVPVTVQCTIKLSSIYYIYH